MVGRGWGSGQSFGLDYGQHHSWTYRMMESTLQYFYFDRISLRKTVGPFLCVYRTSLGQANFVGRVHS